MLKGFGVMRTTSASIAQKKNQPVGATHTHNQAIDPSIDSLAALAAFQAGQVRVPSPHRAPHVPERLGEGESATFD